MKGGLVVIDQPLWIPQGNIADWRGEPFDVTMPAMRFDFACREVATHRLCEFAERIIGFPLYMVIRPSKTARVPFPLPGQVWYRVRWRSVPRPERAAGILEAATMLVMPTSKDAAAVRMRYWSADG